MATCKDCKEYAEMKNLGRGMFRFEYLGISDEVVILECLEMCDKDRAISYGKDNSERLSRRGVCSVRIYEEVAPGAFKLIGQWKKAGCSGFLYPVPEYRGPEDDGLETYKLGTEALERLLLS